MKPLALFRILPFLLLQFDSSGQGQTEIPEPAFVLSNYIQRESVTGNEKNAGEFFAGVCKQKGLHVQIFSSDSDSYNFSASLYPLEDGKPNIIFLNHIDVVPAGDTSAWTYPPYSGTIANDMVWGRGAIDLKGLAVMQLFALAELVDRAAREDFPYNVTMICASQEEKSGSLGVQRILDEQATKLNPVVVFGEGGAGVSGLIESNVDQQIFCISISEKQALWLKLVVKIPSSGHGSVPPSEYANKEMVKALTKITGKKARIEISDANVDMFRSLGKIEKGPRGFVLRNVRLFRPLLCPVFRKDPKVLAVVSNTMTLTNVNNPPGAVNQIAQEITATLDCRLLPGTDKDEFINEIKKHFRKVKVHVELETVNAKPSPIQNPFYQKFKGSIYHVYPGARVIPYIFPAYTDNNYFRNLGVPVYGIKPVHLSDDLLRSIHNVDERLPIKSLQSGIEVYSIFLEKIMTTASPITSIKRK
jgi:carboxypeptidase PM20D1